MPRTNISFSGNDDIDSFSLLGVNLDSVKDSIPIIEKIISLICF